MAIKKFNETLDYGRGSNRVVYVTDPAIPLPEPMAGAEWQEDTKFRLDEDPDFARVRRRAMEDGFAIVVRKT